MLCFQVCGIEATVKDGKLIKVEGMKEHPFSRGVICPRGSYLPDYVYSPDRLKYPLKKKGECWSRISWDEALDIIASRLQQIKKEYGPHSVAFSVGSIGAENIGSPLPRGSGEPLERPISSPLTHCSDLIWRAVDVGTYPLEDRTTVNV
jgi:hypothetical protein